MASFSSLGPLPSDSRLKPEVSAPGALTWSARSNTLDVYQCPNSLARDALHGYLLSAERTNLWGYDIAHANQRDGPMLPHNFNLIYKYTTNSKNFN